MVQRPETSILYEPSMWMMTTAKIFEEGEETKRQLKIQLDRVAGRIV